MTHNTEDAEEIAQDSFVKAYKNIKQFKGKSKFSTWLYQITYFTAINVLRKKNPEVDDIYTDSENEVSYSVPDQLEHEDKQKLINNALQFLNPKERAVINLFYLQELDMLEVAEITKMSLSNVKVSVHRSRKKLYMIMNKLLKNELNSIIHES